MTTRWKRKRRVPPPGEKRLFVKGKEALARARGWLKWCDVFMTGANQDSSHVTRAAGRETTSPRVMGARAVVDLSLGVRQ